MTPSSSQYKKQFEEYIQYFDEKQKAGVILTSSFYIFLLPHCEEVNKIYPIKKSQILGIIASLQEEQEYDLTNVQPATSSAPALKQFNKSAGTLPDQQTDEITNMLKDKNDLVNNLLNIISKN